ncbi:MAG: MFS transporter [bacterium]|nr:MFS transporter [bacterium]
MNKKLIPAYLLHFVNVLGFSILMPILPFVVSSYGAPKWVYGLLLTFYSIFQYVGSPYLGALSDSKGRKPILLVSQAGTLLSWFVFLFALFLPDVPWFGFALPLWIIALSRILDGITGGNVSVTNAYVADITTREEKSYIFGYLGGITGLGMIIGPGLGGFTASGSLGYMGTLLTAIGISVITLVTIFLWVKESHPTSDRDKQKKQSLVKSLFIFKRIKEVNPKPIIKLIFTMKFFFSVMMACYIATIALFLIDLFNFNEKELGIFLFVVGIFLAFNQAFLSKKFIQRFGEFNTLIIGIFCCVVGCFSITLTDNIYLFIAFYYIMNLGLSLSFPTFAALTAIHANPEKQGEIMGISESISSFAMAAFPVVAAAVYGIIGHYVYYFISALPFVSLIIALVYKNRLRKAKRPETSVVN